MRNKSKLKIIILVLGIMFALSTISNYNIIDDQRENKGTIENRDETNFKSPKKSGGYIESSIYIDGMIPNIWSVTASSYGWCYIDNGVYIIENVTIDASSSPTGSGIFIENSKDEYFIIRNCMIYNSGSDSTDAGIRLENTNNGKLIGNNCSNNGGDGIYLHDFCYNNNITGNTLNYNEDFGINIFRYCNNNTISGNTVNNNGGSGMILEFYCYTHSISGNTINNNDDSGIYISIYCSKNNISGNTINNNGDEGIYITLGDDHIVSGNTVNNNGNKGISLDVDSSDNIVSGNTAINNYIGIGLYGGYNILYNNNIIDNNNSAYDHGQDNKWDYGAIGNYWSDYPGKDANDDGFGDTPYNINGNAGSQDNYPFWWDPIVFSINTSNPNDAFSYTAPDFNITINEGIFDTLWYTIDGGLTNFTCNTSDKINQTTWDDLDDGNFTLTCFATDFRGYLTINNITIQKDTAAPIITLDSPTPNQLCDRTPPDFRISIIEENLFSTWYIIESIAENFTFTLLNGTINLTAWNNVPKGEVSITFYAQDRAGTIESVSVVVIKRIPAQPVILGYNLFFLIGTLSLVSILISKKIKKG